MANVDEVVGKSPDKLGPPGTLIFENDRLRIWELILKPGETSYWHDHPTEHVIVLFNGALVADLGSGVSPETAKQFDIPDEQVWVVPANPGKKEWPINLSEDRVLREIIIDLKDGPFEPVKEMTIVPLFDPATSNTAWTPTSEEIG